MNGLHMQDLHLHGIDLFLAAWIFVAGLCMRWHARKMLDAQRRETPTVRIRRVTP